MIARTWHGRVLTSKADAYQAYLYRTPEDLDSLLSLAELDGAFEVIIAAEDVASIKPAPDGYRKALERMNRRRPLDVRTALALEPGSAGARAARGAGLRCAIIAPFRAESVADADAMLESLVGETLVTLEAILPLEAAG